MKLREWRVFIAGQELDPRETVEMMLNRLEDAGWELWGAVAAVGYIYYKDWPIDELPESLKHRADKARR